MRADEALKASKDGKIWFNNQSARTDAFNILWWDTGSVVSLPRIFAEGWQPSQPAELCEACKDARRLQGFWIAGEATISDHLRKYHCTCKK